MKYPKGTPFADPGRVTDDEDDVALQAIRGTGMCVQQSAVFGALLTPFGWLPVGAGALGWFVLAGVINAGAQFAMIEGLRLGRAAVVTPFKYTGLVWAVLLGVLIWGEWPDQWLLLGALVVIGAGIYMSRVPPAAR